MITTAPTPAAVERWQSLAERLNHPSVELTIEEFAPILATFNQLKRAGYVFDPMLIALMDTLSRQVFNTGEDSDSDNDRTGWGA